ncbi:MAG: hypothetical protein AMXMBFR33_46910 [Candidatus Xenobia bacterium]
MLAGLAWAAPVSRVQITPEQCRQHGLAPVELSVDPTGTVLRPYLFPEKGVYLRMSGPPGGPLLMEVLARPGTLDQALAARFSALEERQPATVLLAGAERSALTFLTGQSHARTRWCAVELPSLAVLFGASPAEKDVLTHTHLAPLAASLKVVGP